MRQKMIGSLLAALVVGMSLNAMAGTKEAYVEGVEGIKAASLPPPGFTFRLYNAYYHADRLKDVSGDKIPLNFDVKSYAVVPRFIYLAPVEVLGGNIGADVIVPFVRTDLKMDLMGGQLQDRSTGIGDITIEPFLMAWHGAQYDASAAMGVYVPTANYGDPADFGGDCYTLMPTLGGTLYADAAREWSVSMLNRYETSTYRRHSDIRNGDHFHFEYGLARTFFKTLDVGMAGYCSWQVTDDKGRDVTWNGRDHSRVFAAGPEVNYVYPPAMLMASVRYEIEFGAQDRPEGQIGVLTLTKVF